jgi:hypothetical protein
MSTGTQHGTPGSRNKANRRFDRNRARGNDQRIDRASSASTSAVQPDAAVNIAAVRRETMVLSPSSELTDMLTGRGSVKFRQVNSCHKFSFVCVRRRGYVLGRRLQA